MVDTFLVRCSLVHTGIGNLLPDTLLPGILDAERGVNPAVSV